MKSSGDFVNLELTKSSGDFVNRRTLRYLWTNSITLGPVRNLTC